MELSTHVIGVHLAFIFGGMLGCAWALTFVLSSAMSVFGRTQSIVYSDSYIGVQRGVVNMKKSILVLGSHHCGSMPFGIQGYYMTSSYM